MSVCKGSAAPNPALVYWNFKKAQRAWALGCLSPHCLLNHWRAIGLSMHEKVLSTSTLEKAFKKKKNPIQHPNKYGSIECVSKNTSVLLWALRVLLCHGDLTTPVSVKPTAHRYYSRVTAWECLFIVFVLGYSLGVFFFPSHLSFLQSFISLTRSLWLSHECFCRQMRWIGLNFN